MFDRFKRKKPPASPASDEPLIPVPVPPLVALLAHLEREKGAPLTEAEVTDIRDNCVCIMLPVSAVQKMAKSRGYDDINPEAAWEQWQVVRQQMGDASEGA